MACGTDAATVAKALCEQLQGPDLQIAFVFSCWQLEAAVLARAMRDGLSGGHVVGCTTVGVIAPDLRGADARAEPFSAVAVALYGDWVKVGIGIASELAKSPLTRSRDALAAAAATLGVEVDALDGKRHVGITMVDGKCGLEESFCVGSAASAPQIRVVGGCAASEIGTDTPTYVFVDGVAMSDAGVVIVLDSKAPFQVLRSAHLVATDQRAVVTASSARQIYELDGKPATRRLRELVAALGEPDLDLSSIRTRYSFARYIDNVPYVRSIMDVDDARVLLATTVEPGHVLRVMRPGDLIGTTKEDLARASTSVGGTIAALLVFSCLGRHWEAESRGLSAELAEVYQRRGAVGFQSYGEQTGMLLVNHTLTGLAIGVAP